VVEDQTEIISRLTVDGTLLFVNNAYCRFFGRNREELIGRQWQPSAHPDDIPAIER
jgi:PAS domain S-box-containing protein